MGLLNTTFYPIFGIHSLRSQRGDAWTQLVDHLSRLPASDPQVMALMRTTRQLRRAGHDHSLCHDPFCAVCAAQTVANFDGTESELIEMYYTNLDQIRDSLASMRQRTDVMVAQRRAIAVA